MVRLKELEANVPTTITIAFQFHYGTIKSAHCCDEDKGRYAFQFHYGTIKRMAAVFIKVLL